MSANSQPQTPAIKDWLQSASQQLAAVGIPSAQLDAELLLSYTLNVDRTFLHAHQEQLINKLTLKNVNKFLKLRLNRVPIAYITGHKEFYGRDFFVTPATLIPRPDSEDIIDILKNIMSSTITKLIDVGTGSGCLGITAKLEFPTLDVTLVDISGGALKIAKKNAKNLSANVKIVKNNLLEKFKDKTDIIIANLPYVDETWDRSPETEHEPALALFASDNGLQLIKNLFDQTADSLKNGGYILIEAEPVQHQELIEYAEERSLKLIDKQNYIIAFQKQ